MVDSVAVERDGYRLFVPAHDRDIGAAIQAGAFEPEVEAAFREVVNPGATVVDIGANVGFYTMLAAHLVGPSGYVVAVEPVDKNLQLILLGAMENKFRHVDVWPFAASNRREVVAIRTDDGTSNAQTLRGRAGDCYAPARPLDPLLDWLARLDVVKIDVEGFEPFALAGMSEALRYFKPVVISEFHPQALEANAGIEPEAYAATLFEMAPEVVVLERAAPRTVCRSPAEVMDAWSAANDRFGFSGSLHLDLLVVPPSRGWPLNRRRSLTT